MKRPSCAISLAVAAMMLIGISVAPSAQRGRRAGAGANQGVPLATNTILLNPEAYYGKQVTVSAGVEEMLSPTAFLIDQWRAAGATDAHAIGKAILVIAPYLTASFDRRSYLLVRGELVKFSPVAMARVAADCKLDLVPDVWTRYEGQPVLVATSVLNSTYTELAKKPIPPPSVAEASMSAAMKTINPAFATLRMGAEESKAEVVVRNAATLQPAFTQTETLWDGLGQGPAGQWARDARDRAASIERAAAAGNWEAVKSAATALNELCTSCHATYRERQDDGTFRFKSGTF